jgi:hypothetical protein
MADQNLRFTISAIDKTRAAFGKVAAGLGRVRRSIMSVQGALVALGVGAGLKIMAGQIDDLAKASSRLGLTVNELQSLQFAASQTGASAEELEKGLTRFNRSISEASTGIGTGLRSFEALGISVTDAAGNLRPTNELLNLTADRLKQIESPADRVRVAFDLFGRSGVNLINTLQNGSAEVNKLREQFNAVTIELTENQAKAVETANDNFDKLGQVLKSIGNQITATFLPVLAKVSEFIIVNLLKAISAAIGKLRGFLNSIVDLAKTVNVEMTKFTFGEALEKDIDRIVFNMENAGKAVMDVNGNIKAASVTIQQANKPIQNMANGFQRVQASATGVSFTVNKSKTGLQQYAQAARNTTQQLDNMAVQGLNRLEDSLLGVIQGTTSVKDAFKSMAASIISDMIRMAIQQQVTGVLAGALGGVFGGMFGGGGGISGGAGTAGVYYPAPRAMGGQVNKNTPYIVGERGRELFVPNQSGSIVPNNQIGGGVVVNQTINLSTGVQQTVRAEMTNMLPQIAQAAKGAVLDAKRRGGSFSAAFGG